MKLQRQSEKTDTNNIEDDINIFLGNTIVLCWVERVKHGGFFKEDS